MTADILVNLVAAVLTLCVLSRIIGDNPVFRAMQYLFVGVSLGYGFVVLYHQVLAQVFASLLTETNLMVLLINGMPFVLLLFLLPRITGPQQLSWLANLPLALIFGVGAALALVGSLAGTLLPQMLATVPRGTQDPLLLVSGLVLMLGVIMTLCYFYFTVPRDTGAGRLVASAAIAGRWLLMVVFGFFFAGALVTYLTALSERISFLVNVVRSVGL